MGSQVWCQSKLGCLWLHCTWARSKICPDAATNSQWQQQTRLTAAKEQGGFVLVDNEKVSVGIPGAGSAAHTAGLKDIPLQRGGTPLEAAGAIIALASPFMSYVTGHVLVSNPAPGIGCIKAVGRTNQPIWHFSRWSLVVEICRLLYGEVLRVAGCQFKYSLMSTVLSI